MTNRYSRHDILLRESYHRIKNHLALIVSTLRLEANAEVGATSALALRKAADRLTAVAELYDLLSVSQIDHSIDVHAYLDRVLDGLRRSIQDHRPIVMNVYLDDLTASADLAVRIGILLNELVSNACKYGRSGDGSLTLDVSLHFADGQALLQVADRGPEFGHEATTSTGLGMQIITALVKSLHGRMERASPSGVLITFPVAASDA